MGELGINLPGLITQLIKLFYLGFLKQVFFINLL